GAQQAGAGNVRKHAIEHAPTLCVGIESGVDEVADTATALRASPAVGLLKAEATLAHGVLLAGRIRLPVPEKADEIPNRHVSKAEHERVLCLVDEFVYPPRLEASRQVDVRGRGDQRAFTALVVEPAAAFDARKAPLVGCHRLARF